MIGLRTLIRKYRFDVSADRIGPDIPFTHWKLYFKKEGKKLCKDKFKFFSDSAEVRPGAYCVCCSEISIGDNVVLRPGTMLFADSDQHAGITIEDNVLIGSCVHFYTIDHEFSNPTIPIHDQGYSKGGQIIIKNGAWIGANTTILKGVTIGQNSVVGAGSVVTKDIPPFSVAVGNPAKIIKVITHNCE